MISYTCPGDLKQFGFRCLTGEACGLGMRLLYDVNEDGRWAVARVLGMRTDQLNPPDSWNGGEFDAGSVMLTNEMAITCAIFAMLFKKKCIEVWQRCDNGRLCGDCYGMETAEEVELARQGNIGHGGDATWRRWRTSNHPGSGDRNTHQMSGRTQ